MDKYNYAFEDLVSTGFYYESYSKKIEIYYNDFSDVNIGIFEETKCKLVIEDWEDAESRNVSLKTKYDLLERHLNIIHEIYFTKWQEDDFCIFVGTINGALVDLLFKKPKVSLIIL